MSLLRSLFSRRKLAADPRKSAKAFVTLEQYEQIQPTATLTDGDIEVVFCTPSQHTKWRIDSFFTKEPDTLEWIRGFSAGEILVDVGANIGMYSVWAAKTRDVRVFAFEPESQNYALLYRNIVANELAQQVTGYCLALAETSRYDRLHLSHFLLGGSGHMFGLEADYQLRPRPSAVSQGCVSATLDELVACGAVEAPHYIKLDVDGLEHAVLAGARGTLRSTRLKSVLVEINTRLAEHRALIDEMKALGFTYSEAQVARAMRTSGDFEGCANHVFFR
ncbi:MAG: FkbM family methyltransferase [Burkholderiales bacterium]